MEIFENSKKVEQKIQQSLEKSGRSPQDLTVVAVTKTKTIPQVEELYQFGYRHFAENRVEGFLEKKEDMNLPEVKWHFIGSLQTRKVKTVINEIDYFHALDRESLAKEINKRADHTIACFVQVNVTGETSKHGVSPDGLESFIHVLSEFPMVKVVGLMTMAPVDANESELHECFGRLKNLQEVIEAKQLEYAPCRHTSMGMSNDYEIAIQEGASFVRIGSAFFE
ncbi:YggS family pyridoxal phosphate-dependent enzyme [Jeotgalibaca sp. MA1X17-3]|uniref:YggS family pyridoxal phosphate-dependent enzyme n=1 Tax=Jeotgalibaca sp. MA1X17-3 TaxID=2908211 RepID=UPI001F34C4F9|nr:YggS family pyridoxal phosphate-dependent enzyme [Jeotgalibaca sp. MA1X17-3]UJF15122.1 YggS family pyridoxal phosphate-dependent enzyme [Jeotgalibaca sp. MA1X17-3]